jgi:TadE-like protein
MLRKIAQLRRLSTETSGQEVAEAALVLPIAFLILLGIFWFGRAYNIYATVTHAAAEGARVAAMSTCATCGNTSPDSGVQNSVNAILQASRLDTSQINAPTTPDPKLCTTANSCICPGLMPPPACTSAGNIRICRGVELNDPSVSSPQTCGATVRFRYPYQFITFNFQLIYLPASAEARVED